MFGNPEYFHKDSKRIPKPAGIAGWMFYGLWFAAIIGPTVAMFLMGKQIEPLVWVTISGIWFGVDLVKSSRAIRRQRDLDELFYIGEQESHISTTNYDLNLRKPLQQ